MQLAYAVTRVMHANDVGEVSLEACWFHYVVQKLHHVHDLLRREAFVIALGTSGMI